MSSADSGGETQILVRQMLKELLSGSEDPQGFFGLCVSLMGHRDTRTRFLSLIQPLSSTHRALHSSLTSIYVEYFSADEKAMLEATRSLSMLEHTDRQQRTVKPTSSQPGAQGYRHSQTKPGPQGHTRPTSVSLPLVGSYAKVVVAGSHAHTQGSQTTPHNVAHCSVDSLESKHEKPKDDVTTEEGHADQSEKPKHSRNRRRRKGCGQQVVGLSCNPSAPPPVLLWFRRDLRLCDNPALIGSLEVGAPVIPVFIWSPEEEEGPGVTVAMGGASKFWLHQALACLSSSLENIGSHLVFREEAGEGSSLKALRELIKETGARTVVASALYEPWLKERDEEVVSSLLKEKVECRMFHSYCLREPYSVSTQGVGLRGIGSVAHFRSCCEQSPGPGRGVPLDPPSSLPSPSLWPQSCPLDKLGLARMPRRKDGTVIDWAANIRTSWDFSEAGAQARLEAFLHDGVYRRKESGRADAPNTSYLSPYIHFGQLSPRWLLWDAKEARCRSPKFQRKLAWRDLAYWQLTIFPDLPWESLRPPYKALRRSSERGHLRAWQRGRTGYPLVDAAMRQLWATGWMNNYMRHVVASFLIAYLHLPWQEGYRWFQDTLVDADVAIDAMMWQNGGMCGLDHWNFVMHPVSAAMTCDPSGHYVRKWCPELAKLPDELIHKPWACPASMLRRAGVVFGQSYPDRVVEDLEDRRNRSLQDVALVRKRFGEYVDPQSGCDLIPLPQRLLTDALGVSEDGVFNHGKQFLMPVITRMEFKHQSDDPDSDAASNPYNAVLKGYVSRKRDETIASLNQRDFMASVMNEGTERRERLERNHRKMEGLPPPSVARGRARPTPTDKDRSSTVPGGVSTTRR